MRPILKLLCCTIFLLLVVPATWAAEQELETTADNPIIRQLLEDLTQASLNDSQAIIDQLEAAGGSEMLPVFQAMLDGNLYYDEDTLQVLSLVEINQGEEIARDIITAEVIQLTDNTDFNKIRVNNRLRRHLREAIARVQLLDGSTAQRKAAANSILEDINGDSVALLQLAKTLEQEQSVIRIIDIGIAMHTIAESEDPQQRLQALSILHGRLEIPVRNLLTTLTAGSESDSQDPLMLGAIESLKSIERKTNFYGFIEQLFFGLSLGSVLLLAAVGLAVTFGVMGVINMAHGEMLMLGAYTTYVVQLAMPNFISLSIWVAIPAAFMVSATVGVLIQRYVIRFLNGRPLETLLATFGISLILQQTVRTIFSPLNRRVVSPEWMSGSLQVNPVLSLTYNRLFILLFALIVFTLLLIVLKRTSLGLNVRAVSQNREMAQAMGIKTDRVDALTFALGSGIAGIAGVALSQLTNVGPNLGQAYIIDSFMVVVFGGVGNLLGTFVGAFSLGITSKFLEPVTGAVLSNILVLVFIILFIQKRPKGLFPQKGRAAE